jgi:choline kinase
MGYRVLIPTAGTGSRLGPLTTHINKSLVGIANRPTISHIIEQFPKDAEFVIPLGYKGNLVKEFLTLAYPGRKFFFTEVAPYEGPGSGLGLSILTCQEYLQQPFVFISCDTLVQEKIPKPDHNWMGYARRTNTAPYRTLQVTSGKVTAICEKKQNPNTDCLPYIGLAGIKEYTLFWEAMTAGGDDAITAGEAHGLRRLLAQGITARQFTWHDTGDLEALGAVRKIYQSAETPNILEKATEAIWFIDNQVIKFSTDSTFIANRVSRAKELAGFVPEVTRSTVHMYAYKKVNGEVLSKIATLPLFKKLLDHSKAFWTPSPLNDSDQKTFRNGCLKFYKNKTAERIALFYKNFNKKDGTESINGLPMPPLRQLLDSLDWRSLTAGLPGRFHGDFHFENILYSTKTRQFTFLDWRQDFAGSLTVGDIYYDLAKLLHGLIICHELIAKNCFRIDWQDESIRFDFSRKPILIECEQYYFEWLVDHGYDRKKVRILTALIYLNIAALHHFPYSLLLYALGKQLLYKELRE